jgi:hypothetical protein
MARYLVIEFDEDAQADALCARINAATAAGKKYRVVGLFARPSRWCGCPRPAGVYKPKKLFQGSKYGWWTCPDCRRARLGDHQPTNLVPEPEEPWTGEGVDSASNLEVPSGSAPYPVSH